MDNLSLTMDTLIFRDGVGEPKIMPKKIVHANGSLTPPWTYEHLSAQYFLSSARKLADPC
jgi:hypothetical protein